MLWNTDSFMVFLLVSSNFHTCSPFLFSIFWALIHFNILLIRFLSVAVAHFWLPQKSHNYRYYIPVFLNGWKKIRFLNLLQILFSWCWLRDTTPTHLVDWPYVLLAHKTEAKQFPTGVPTKLLGGQSLTCIMKYPKLRYCFLMSLHLLNYLMVIWRENVT